MRASGLSVIATTFALALVLGGCATTASTAPETQPATQAQTQAPETQTPETQAPATQEPAGACDYVAGGRPAAKAVNLPPSTPTRTGKVPVTINTSVGELKLTLDADLAPCTVNSFVSLAEQGYFDGTTCHRLTTQGIYVLQCGDPSATGTGGPGYSFKDEPVPAGEEYPAGTLAMANSGPNTNGSQFFLVYQDAPGALAPNYTVFGSMDPASTTIVQNVAKDGLGPDGTKPKTPVDISGVTVG